MICRDEEAILTIDLPTYRLKRGDIGTVVDIDKSGRATLEFSSLDGKTLAIVLVLINDIRPVNSGEIAHARTWLWC
jgi:hypothetical protein